MMFSTVTLHARILLGHWKPIVFADFLEMTFDIFKSTWTRPGPDLDKIPGPGQIHHQDTVPLSSFGYLTVVTTDAGGREKSCLLIQFPRDTEGKKFALGFTIKSLIAKVSAFPTFKSLIAYTTNESESFCLAVSSSK